ncbi:restriction endonuclease subunit S [Nocardioides halotolerans]|uniref:restriction endonuclease subunit S n=1 Tax=Nocardioides halotolerans TaxID=433660 RepID=UPI00041E04BF|nr:restriction endonuclease subunit S [Nocardioides halotolerans]
MEKIDERIPGADLPLMSVSQTRGVIRRSELTDAPQRAESLDNYKVCRANDIVFNKMSIRSGAMGVAAEDGLVTYHYEVMRPRHGTNAHFIAYLMKSSWFTEELIKRERGIGAGDQANVRTTEVPFSVLKTIDAHIPDYLEQRAIADYLDRETARIDTLIKEQQRLIAMLHERRQAAVEEAVSIVATNGPRLKHLIRSVRQGWSPQCYAWPTDGVETWAVLKAGAANGGRFRPMENKELPEDEAPRPDIVVARGDLIVSRANTRELVGSAAVVEGDFPRLMLCDKLYAFSLDEDRADPRFVAAVLGSRRWRDLIELEATGASHSMLNVSQSDIVNLPMPLPPVNEQRRMVARLDRETAKIDRLIVETERFIALARERRAALITAAVTGQIDVREAA